MTHLKTLVPLLALVACAGTQRSAASPDTSPAGGALTPAQIVSAGDRTERDRSIDAKRKPVETLAFLRLRPGMRVAEIGAGGGYSTELIARSVGPSGKVYAQNRGVIGSDPNLIIPGQVITWPSGL